MTSSSIHQAVYSALDAVLDIPIALGSFGDGVGWPCCTFAVRDRPKRLYGGNMGKLSLQVSLFSNDPGAAEVLGLSDLVAAMDGQTLSVSGMSTTALRLTDRMAPTNSLDGVVKVWQAVLNFEFECA